MYTRLKWYPCSEHSHKDGLHYSNRTVNETGRLMAYIMAGGDNAEVVGEEVFGTSVQAKIWGGEEFTLRTCSKCGEG
jgi:hypothetical protein